MAAVCEGRAATAHKIEGCGKCEHVRGFFFQYSIITNSRKKKTFWFNNSAELITINVPHIIFFLKKMGFLERHQPLFFLFPWLAEAGGNDGKRTTSFPNGMLRLALAQLAVGRNKAANLDAAVAAIGAAAAGGAHLVALPVRRPAQSGHGEPSEPQMRPAGAVLTEPGLAVDGGRANLVAGAAGLFV